jgi:hypothetical protein
MSNEKVLEAGTDRLIYVDPGKVRHKALDAVVISEGRVKYNCAEVTIDGPSKIIYERNEGKKGEQARVWIKTDCKLILHYESASGGEGLL